MGKESKISVIDFFCIGFGAIVGVGWAVSINGWIGGSGGPLPAAVGYIIALVLMIPISLCYCELCSMLPVSGGGMAYAFRAFGDNIAFISGWAAFGAFITIIPWEAIYVVDILSIIFPVLKLGAPLYSLAGADIYIGHIVVGTIISVILYFVNRKGVGASASLQKILCLALVGAGILAMICASVRLDFDNFYPIYENVGQGSHNSFMGGVFSILASVPFFLAGFETIPQGIESAGGNTKNIGKTVVVTVVLSCLFYALLLFTLGGAVPWKEFLRYENPAAAILFKELYPGSVGQILYVLILFGAICGLLTTWNGFMMASSQILMAMARVSIVPYTLAQQHTKYKTPVNALKVCLVASLIGPFLGSGLIGSLTTFSAAGYVSSWAITAFCLIKLRKKEPELKRPYKIPGGLATAWFAGIIMTTLLVLLFIPNQPVYMGTTAVLLFAIWMFVGLVLFVRDARQRKKYSQLKRATFLFASMSENDIGLPAFANLFEEDYQVLSFVVPNDVIYNGKTLMELGWGQKQNILIVKIEYGANMVILPGAKITVDGGNRVFAIGLKKSIRKFIDFHDIGEKYTITSMKDFMGYGDTERQSPLSCAEVKVTGKEPYCDKELKEAGIQNNYHCMIVGIKREEGDILMMPEATTMICQGDTLWVMGSDEDLEKFKTLAQ